MPANSLRQHRERSRLTQAQLAEEVGLSRQSLHAIESARSVPSVTVALKLARVLGTDVESLFAEAHRAALEARLVGSVRKLGARVLVGSVRERWVAHPLASDQLAASHYAADGFVRTLSGGRRAALELARSEAELHDTVFIGGCAPGLGVLADRLNDGRGPGRFRWLTQSNAVALRALEQGNVHLAGVHMGDREPERLARTVARHLPGERAKVYALAAWEAGLVLSPKQAARTRDVSALARPGLRFALREQGSGARAQLARLMRAEGLDLARLGPRAVAAHSHMAVAQAVHLGAADLGFAIRGAALAFGLPFVPLVKERFDLVVPGELSDDARVLRMFDVLASASFRRELGELGYDASVAAQPIAEVRAHAG